ncbi:hypothetical protein K449DRAFT_436160 [Hypoxylon sp. EC38]|nr:hypothetical protein K449DRAFT_436160 [Hypoxylon sp. EC38]
MDNPEPSQPEKGQPGSTNEKEENLAHGPQWGSLLQLLSERLDEATKTGGQEMSVEGHKAHYRAIFNKVREEAASRDDIPNAIMEKPTKTLILTFYGKWKQPACLGCVDFHDTNDVIHIEIWAKENEPDGVTKDDLINRIAEVLYGGLHVLSRGSKEEMRIIPSGFDWMGTTKLCNLVDSILYVGYRPVTETFPTGEKNHKLGNEQDNRKETYDVVWGPETLTPGARAIQGYDVDFSRRLMEVKGWNQDDLDAAVGF